MKREDKGGGREGGEKEDGREGRGEDKGEDEKEVGREGRGEERGCKGKTWKSGRECAQAHENITLGVRNNAW
jgi:hypothetical protein